MEHIYGGEVFLLFLFHRVPGSKVRNLSGSKIMIASHSIRCPPVSWKVVQNPRTYRLGSHNFPYDSCVDKYRHTYNQSANCCRIHFPATSMSAVVSCSATAKLTPKVSLRNPRTRLLWTPSPCRVARRNVAAKAEVTNGNGA